MQNCNREDIIDTKNAMTTSRYLHPHFGCFDFSFEGGWQGRYPGTGPCYSDRTEPMQRALMSKGPAFQSFELVVAQDEFILLNEEKAIARESNIFLDYEFDHESQNLPRHRDGLSTICRAYSKTPGREFLIPLRETAPIRGELDGS
ncbi:uncharacterized protein N7515_008582 [Penicillium bovifimosum]|uniref:Uncharacterized protein n=1 Tax=Penicillium bovifimosum TaxID=126998 RepID=A0A9W9GPJ8_9EURO|nr:uncharacterized protein N7515_008582 [Penicillium bovifimosum]KAJ5124757.1 hypothetical protein N7515_008582 [Penicillium bovifimosum]